VRPDQKEETYLKKRCFLRLPRGGWRGVELGGCVGGKPHVVLERGVVSYRHGPGRAWRTILASGKDLLRTNPVTEESGITRTGVVAHAGAIRGGESILGIGEGPGKVKTRGKGQITGGKISSYC